VDRATACRRLAGCRNPTQKGVEDQVLVHTTCLRHHQPRRRRATEVAAAVHPLVTYDDMLQLDEPERRQGVAHVPVDHGVALCTARRCANTHCSSIRVCSGSATRRPLSVPSSHAYHSPRSDCVDRGDQNDQDLSPPPCLPGKHLAAACAAQIHILPLSDQALCDAHVLGAGSGLAPRPRG